MMVYERIKLVDLIVADTEVSLKGWSTAALASAAMLSKHYRLPTGTLVRRALAILELDNAEKVERLHLREAAQHLLIKMHA